MLKTNRAKHRIIDYHLLAASCRTGSVRLAPAPRTRNPKPPDPKDEIEVVGHIPLTGGPVKRFLATQHYSSYYLYAEHEAGGNVTLIDVTKTEPACCARRCRIRSQQRFRQPTVVAGTAALVTSEPAASSSRTAAANDPDHGFFGSAKSQSCPRVHGRHRHEQRRSARADFRRERGWHLDLAAALRRGSRKCKRHTKTTSSTVPACTLLAE